MSGFTSPGIHKPRKAINLDQILYKHMQSRELLICFGQLHFASFELGTLSERAGNVWSGLGVLGSD